MLFPAPESLTLTEFRDRTGSEIGALNEQFKQIFGWKTRTTGSGIIKLTWLNSAIRGNQNAQTLVDMIQIGQWYGTKAENSRPRKEPYRPTVKFRDINKDLLRAVATGVKPATDNVMPDVDTGHDSEDSEDLPDDVEDDVVDHAGG
ncbi:hypothetical protein P692DRAFT_201858164 [Suillus brevipes Sb2]|nr:hypothetical protein P692DRAFT_201858164 [Suillus brevipes Sb2]